MAGRLFRNRDFLSGLVLLGLGVLAFATALNYPMGTASRMGPGYFPIVLSGMLIGLGVALALMALRRMEPRMEPFRLRPLFFAVLSVVLFGLLLERVGLVISAVVVVLVSCLGGGRPRVVESLALAAFLAFGVVALFVYALNIPFPVWPGR